MFSIFRSLVAAIVVVVGIVAVASLAGCSPINVWYDRNDPADPNRPGMVTNRDLMTGPWSR